MSKFNKTIDWDIIQAAATISGNVDLSDPGEFYLVARLKVAVTYQDACDVLEDCNYHRMHRALRGLLSV